MSKPGSGKPPQAIRQNNVSVVCFRTFLAVHGFQTFAGAAKNLDINESSVRRNITELERWLSKTLFVRGRKLALTPDGATLLPIAHDICGLLEEAKSPSDFQQFAESVGFSESEVIDTATPFKLMQRVGFEID